MSEAVATWKQTTFLDSDEFICSRESVDGSTRYSSLDGQKQFRSGPDHVPASHSPSPESEKGKATNGISGRKCSDSCEIASLQSCLESKLRQLLVTGGLMEYSQTWKEKATPAGRLYLEHTASVRRTSGSGCGGWQSTALTAWPTSDHHRHGEIHNDSALMRRVQASRESGSGKRQLNLQDAVKLTGWNTPRATDGTNGGPNQSGGALPADAALTGWATPAARDWRDGKTSQETMSRNSRPLNEQATMLTHWDTPQASWASAGATCRSGNRKDEMLTPGVIRGLSSVSTGSRGVLAPEFSRWLMGFPQEWDAASPGYSEWCEVQERIALAGSRHTAMQ